MSDLSERGQFLQVAGLPGRLTVRETAWLLGFSDHDIRVLASHGMLKPLGNPPPNGGRYYALPEIEPLRRDAKWLHKASAILIKHWKTKNANRRTDLPAGFLNPARTGKENSAPNS